jgi:hypothetical protein
MHPDIPIHVAGHAPAALLAAYAAVWTPEIAAVVAHEPPATHHDASAPQFLNVLRVGDVPDILGLLAPQPLVIETDDPRFANVAEYYRAAGAVDRLEIRHTGRQ